tara:strand:+ start:156 stop:617 length:462 start_codon:yes stop_codon:yes gene_type:complete
MSKINVNTIADASGTSALTIDTNGVISPSNPVYGYAEYQGTNITSSSIIPLNHNIFTSGGVTVDSNQFVIPVTGIYLITGHHLGGTTGNDGFSIDVNNNEICRAYQKLSTANSETSLTIIRLLSATDTVRFYCWGGEIHGNSDYNHMSVSKLG